MVNLVVNLVEAIERHMRGRQLTAKLSGRGLAPVPVATATAKQAETARSARKKIRKNRVGRSTAPEVLAVAAADAGSAQDHVREIKDDRLATDLSEIDVHNCFK